MIVLPAQGSVHAARRHRCLRTVHSLAGDRVAQTHVAQWNATYDEHGLVRVGDRGAGTGGAS